jgi:hypothetical protein
MIVSIVKDPSGIYEVWLARLQPEGSSESEETPSTSCILRTRDLEKALDVAAGVLYTWR